MGRSSQVIAPNEGVVAHRERAAGRKPGDAGSNPACEAPYLRRHLSICSPRSSTAREHSDLILGDVGSIPIGSANFDGPLSLGYRLSPKGRAGSNPAPA